MNGSLLLKRTAEKIAFSHNKVTKCNDQQIIRKEEQQTSQSKKIGISRLPDHVNAAHLK
jgi:hypothetical protein